MTLLINTIELLSKLQLLGINHFLDPSLLEQEKEALIVQYQAAVAYEKYLHQNNKITWLRLGDDCTNYFHAAMKSWRTKKRILSYMDNGIRVDSFEMVVNHFLHHFHSFMDTESMVSEKVNHQFISCGKILSVDQQLDLIKPFTMKEIKAAMHSIGINKSPGLNGFGSGFFKQS